MEPQRAREWYDRHRPEFEVLTADMCLALGNLAAEHMIDVEVHGRAKSVLSFVKKIHRKERAGNGYGDPTVEITDLAGVRGILLTGSQRDRLCELIEDHWPGSVIERKSPAIDQLGYRGVHVTIDTRADGATAHVCEIQLRTVGEDMWNRLSHSLLYKPDLELPELVRRNVYLLQALGELVDAEAERGLTAMTANPLYPTARLLALAEREFTPRTGRSFDRELSLEILLPLSEAITDLEDYGRRLHAFAEAHDGRLTQVLSQHADDTVNFILSQPESVVLFYEQDRDEFKLRDLWDRNFAPDILDGVISAWPSTV